MNRIKSVKAMQVLDSRGNPTLQVKVTLEDGTIGKAIVPSGASTGSFEAVELRDGDKNKYMGKSVEKAVRNVNEQIAVKLTGEDIFKQNKIDLKLVEIDGTDNKANLGANATLGVSLACSDAAAKYLNMPLYEYIGGVSGTNIPIPMMNILNGGKHSDNNVNIQEFMIVPVGGKDFKEMMQIASEIYHTLKKILKERGLSTAVGDEGGFAPNLSSDEEALQLIVEAIEKAGYKPREDVALALDVAATEMYEEAKKAGKENGYLFWKTGEYMSTIDMIDYLEDLVEQYPIISIEDGLAEEDWEGWKELTKRLGDKIQLVGDDLFVTNIKRLEKGIKNNVANSILIKPNQIGTLTETLNAIKLAKANGYSTVISHRSGETEDTFIADLSVAINSRYIKAGAPARTDRVAKYNRILNIEDELYN
ncbi:MAG: phosphopyruvate hydratase [Clostridiales bacterium]|nr:phosphopyruvate hydratase [Clostridiales bacterium]